MATAIDRNLRDVPKVRDKIDLCQKNNRIFFSFEFFPPKTPIGVENLDGRIARLAKLEPLFCDITWGARGSTAKLTLEIAGNIQQYHGVDCMMHLTCTNMPSGTAREGLKDAKDHGVRNILALRGDPPDGETWKETEGGFAHALDLVRFIKSEFGDYFGITVAGYPEGHPDGYLSNTISYEDEMDHLKEKIEAGGEVVITQMFYDVEAFLNFVRKCRDEGIKVPILPGILPIQNYGGFRRMTGFCKTKIPASLDSEIEKIKDDEEAVKELGVRYAVDMCRTILASGLSPGLHFYTLNMEVAVTSIIEGLDLVPHTESIRSLPWRPATIDARRHERVRPVFWANRGRSYLYRTSKWDHYPDLRWENGNKHEFKDLSASFNLLRNEETSQGSKEKLRASLGEVSSTSDVGRVFAKFLSQQIPRLPWSDGEQMDAETALIAAQLTWMNKNGYFTINSQPRVNGAPSKDPVFGWGAANGYVYQKSYVEFFMPSDKVKGLADTLKDYPEMSYMAATRHNDNVESNLQQDSVNALTWGVFPNSEVIQPTVVDKDSFLAWKREAFDVWTKVWAALYEEGSESHNILSTIAATYSLVSLVNNDFVQGDVFGVISQNLKN